MPPKVPFNQGDFNRDWRKAARRRLIGVVVLAAAFIGAAAWLGSLLVR